MTRLLPLAVFTAMLLPASVHAQSQYYRGIVTNDGMPSSPAVLELAINPSTDTSMAGWMRVHTPLAGTGIAFASRVSGTDSLVVVSVATSGDTIVWRSATHGALLSGQYFVSGGPSAGQRGTWSLSAASDPSAIIRVAGGILLSIVAVLALLTFSYRKAPSWWGRRSARHLSEQTRRQLTGVGGWLGWFFAVNALLLVVLLVRLTTDSTAGITVSWAMGDLVPLTRPVLLVEQAAGYFQLLGLAIGLFLIMRRRPETPLFWAAFLLALGVYALFDITMLEVMAAQFGSWYGHSMQDRIVTAASDATTQNTRLVLGALIWGWYWLVSKRVYLTFAPQASASAVGPAESGSGRQTTHGVTSTQLTDVELSPAALQSTASVSTMDPRGEVPANVPTPQPTANLQLPELPSVAPERRRIMTGKRAGLVIAFVSAAIILVWKVDHGPSGTDSSPRRPATTDTTSNIPPVTALSPTEIAGRARAATVQIEALDANGRTAKQGTGFFLSQDGLLATNLHVIQDARALRVTTLAGDVYDDVYFVTSDARRDLAILKVPVDDAKPLVLAVGAEPSVGDRVYAMGNPLGQLGTFSDGLLSATRQVDGMSLLQMTAPVSPGSSGGPVLNAQGEVIGIATLKLRGGENLNYAVPVRYIRPLLTTGDAPQRFEPRLVASATVNVHDNDATAPRVEPAGESRAVRPAPPIESEAMLLDSTAASGGGTMVGHTRDWLAQGFQKVHPAAIDEARTYAIVGFCDSNCLDLDLAVYGPDGTLVGADTATDATPVVRFTARESGQYKVTVIMAVCAKPRCAYAVRMYRY